MFISQRLTLLSALQKFIRRGWTSRAVAVAAALPPAMCTKRLEIIAVEDIGPANLPLLQGLLPVTEERIAEVVEALAQSYKCRLCSYYSYYFRQPSPPEPWPARQQALTSAPETPAQLAQACTVAGSMYLKGMDEDFWNTLAAPAWLQELAHRLRDDRAAPMVWICALIWRWLQDAGVPLPSRSDEQDYSEPLPLDVEPDVKGLLATLPDWVFDGHTTVGKRQGRGDAYFFTESIKVRHREPLSALLPVLDEYTARNFAIAFKRDRCEPIKLNRSATYCVSSPYFYVRRTGPGAADRRVQIATYDMPIEEAVALPTAETLGSLADLGILQIPMTNTIGGRPYVIYFWHQGTRYMIKPHADEQYARRAAQADSLMAKYYYRYPWARPSVAICLRDQLGRLHDEYFKDETEDGVPRRYWYVMSRTLPYFTPTTVALRSWKDDEEICTQIILINFLKWIFGIPDRTARNTGVYLTRVDAQIQLRVCSFDHGSILAQLGGEPGGKLGRLPFDQTACDWLQSLIPALPSIFRSRAQQVVDFWQPAAPVDQTLEEL